MIKIFKITSVLLIATLVFLFTCSKKTTEPEPTEFKWTILGYFDGNHSQDRAPDGGSYVIKDLQELEQIGSTGDVQVLVMLGSFKTDGKCKYYHVKTDSSEVLLDLDTTDMSDPTTLRDFVSFGIQNYSAEHYMLIINDHGRGWKGICSDTIKGKGNWMSLPDLSSALAGFGFDIIWFYTPSMATAEVAYQIKDRADYMIASQFKWYPDNIMGSTEWLPYLTDNPDIDVWRFAWKVTEAIKNAAQEIGAAKPFQSVLIHLAKISQLATDVSNLATDLIDSTGIYWTEVWDAWTTYPHNYVDCDSIFVDLREFARQIDGILNLNSAIKSDAQDVEISVNAAVLVQYNYLDYGTLGGISIHLPWNQDDFDSTNYDWLDFSETNWHSFISVFIQSFLGNYAGTLNIKSIPTGARVFLNEVDTEDTTDVIIGELLPGEYTVKLVKSGYRDFTFPTVDLKPQQTIEFPTAILLPGF